MAETAGEIGLVGQGLTKADQLAFLTICMVNRILDGRTRDLSRRLAALSWIESETKAQSKKRN